MAPWLGEWGETSPCLGGIRHPFLLVPKNSSAQLLKLLHCQHVCLRGCRPVPGHSRVSEGCSLHSERGGSCEQSPFSFKLLEHNLLFWQYAQP